MAGIQHKRICILCLVACLCFGMFASCKGKTNGSGQTDTTGPLGDGPATYVVQIQTEGGMAMKDIGIYVYEDETLSEMVTFAKTDKEGKIQFEAPASDGYAVVLKDVPQGYTPEEKYILKELETQIVLKAELKEIEDLEEVSFSLGDVMGELSVTTYDGKTLSLSQLLEEKEMVLLNFWYLECTPCKMEFPHLQEAYEKYSDKVEILALNPVDGDDESLKEYAQNLGLTFPVATCDALWQKAMKVLAYPTSVVIDRYGVISFIYQGYFDSVQSIEDVFAHFTAEDYEQGVIRDLEELLTQNQEDEEKIENPTEVGGVTSFQLTVRAGETVYCDLYRVDGMYMQIKSSNAVLEYRDETYTPSNGVIGLVVHCKDVRTPTPIGLKNTGKETETFTITFSALLGTLNNPYPMELGEFDVSVPAGSDQGIYYQYVAQEDGMLTLQCLSATAGIAYDYTLYNLNSYANRNLESNGEQDADGNTVVRVSVKKGQVVQFIASAMPDDRGSYPAISMVFKAYIDNNANIQEEQVVMVPYGVTVTDGERSPIKGLQVIFVDEKGQNQTAYTNEKGAAALKLPEGTYKATVRLSEDYTGNTTSFTLTSDRPTVSLKLDKVVKIVYKDYTIRVVDEKGNPLTGALVVIGEEENSKSAMTDAKGTAVFNMPEGIKSVTVLPPAGYTGDKTVYNIGSNGKLTVTLKKGSSPVNPSNPSNPSDPTPSIPVGENETLYTVKVTDYYGDPFTSALVTVKRGSTIVAWGMVDTNGEYKVALAKGSYRATVDATDGKQYDSMTANLRTAAPSAVVKAIPLLGTEYISTYVDSTTYKLALGATHLTGLQQDVENCFVYYPSEPGVYTVSSPNSNAVIRLMGNQESFLDGIKTSAEKGYVDSEIREESLESSAVYVSVTGVKDCIISITRKDIVFTEEDLAERAEYIEYEGTVEPSKTHVRQGELTYVDLGGKTEDYKLVLGSDGFYHLGSASGKIIYVNLGPSGQYGISFWNMLGYEQSGGTNVAAYFYDEDGKFVKKERYNSWLKKYTDCLESDGSGFYPLTEDLAYILQNVTQYKGWGDPSDENNFIFSGVSNYNRALAWLFSCGTLN